MKNIKSLSVWAVLAVATALLWSCTSADGNHTGTEYMPDMGHSIAYEANYDAYYYNNTWGTEEEYEAYAQPRKPVDGTVARGYLPNKYNVLDNFRESPEEAHIKVQERVRKLMMEDPEIVNPIKPQTDEELNKILESGKYLYTQHCWVCHGEKLDGNGPLYNEGNGKYSAKPANLINDEMQQSSDGRFLNAIMHGKGMMQSHADKLSPLERWKVIHYIRSAQAKEKGEEYSLGISVDGAAIDLTTSFATLLEKKKDGQSSQDLKVALDDVLYSTGKATLKPSSNKTLDELMDILQQYDDIRIEIGGHTDDVGNAAKNMQLSEDRAHSVYDYLVGKGIDKSRLSYKGYGDTMPVASNDTEDGKARNRRTEVKIVE